MKKSPARVNSTKAQTQQVLQENKLWVECNFLNFPKQQSNQNAKLFLFLFQVSLSSMLGPESDKTPDVCSLEKKSPPGVFSLSVFTRRKKGEENTSKVKWIRRNSLIERAQLWLELKYFNNQSILKIALNRFGSLSFFLYRQEGSLDLGLLDKPAAFTQPAVWT